jgi:hypothetical protein
MTHRQKLQMDARGESGGRQGSGLVKGRKWRVCMRTGYDTRPTAAHLDPDRRASATNVLGSGDKP